MQLACDGAIVTDWALWLGGCIALSSKTQKGTKVPPYISSDPELCQVGGARPLVAGALASCVTMDCGLCRQCECHGLTVGPVGSGAWMLTSAVS